MVPLDMQKTQQISGATLLTIDRWDTTRLPIAGTEILDFGNWLPALSGGSVSRDSLPKSSAPRRRSKIAECSSCFVNSIPTSRSQHNSMPRPWKQSAIPSRSSTGTGQLRSRHVEGGFRRSGNGAAAGGIPAGRLGVCAPFIAEVEVMGSKEPRYEFILQYWFFYPFNDAGNKHEADWEHINVVISPMSEVTAPQTASQVEQLLTRGVDQLDGSDPVVIRRIHFYFHYNDMPVDFGTPHGLRLARRVGRQVKALPGQARRRANRRHGPLSCLADSAETKVNTHPIAYIGADSKGLDLLLYAPGPKNHDGHGTYPFVGIYEGIGPAAAFEEVRKEFDHHVSDRRGCLPVYVEPLTRSPA